MHSLNQRPRSEVIPQRKRVSLLLEFPEQALEAIVIQWDSWRPTVLVQLKKNPNEPLVLQNEKEYPALANGLSGFINPATGEAYSGLAQWADILFSARSFSALQPEPDLVLPEQALWECRAEALEALLIADEPSASLALRESRSNS